MAGNLFVVRGDLRRLACDAWLLPGNGAFGFSHVWEADAPASLAGLRARAREVQPPPGWRHDGVRVCLLVESAAGAGVDIWLGNTGSGEGESVDWYVECIRQFVSAAAPRARARGQHRARPLLGFPLVGTGLGGQAAKKAPLVKALLREAIDLAATNDVDIALVVWSLNDFAAVQRFRRDERLGPTLDGEHAAVARALGERARDGSLVVFFGAGVSVGAGLPTWTGLLEKLACRAGIEPDEQARLEHVGELDRARVIEARLAARGLDLREVIDEIFGDPEPASLAHFQLASLPVTDFVTTNYDTRFETACSYGQGSARPAVIPFESAVGARRRLLKMHGTVAPARQIVLTREEYLSYGERRGALSGIVQALLITRHMLFIGFSLNDDNFHRIAFDVRKALSGDSGLRVERFGTALAMNGKGFLRDIWGQDIDIVELGADLDDGIDAQARILDEVLLQSTSAVGHLLDPAYGSSLSEDEDKVRIALEQLGEAAQDTIAAPAVERLLREFGGRVS